MMERWSFSTESQSSFGTMDQSKLHFRGAAIILINELQTMDIGEQYRKAVEELCSLLNVELPEHLQGWERQVASVEHVSILIQAIPKFGRDPCRREILAEVILGSLDDELAIGGSIEQSWPKVEAFLVRFASEFIDIIEYWACVDDEPEDRFYMSKYVLPLRQRLASAKN